ncbi:MULTISPECIES: hypothetical protein [Streptosporangium]|uniref:DUF4386 domain-containing protein n=1 Tax=Streptosporangium brasiliense TaxID=47480 RepID=A0ABT9QWN9_9ACTN|nr:hypothetical protein [Streptosporangium brasiliense]MDP9861403.1 hypothetical protein [Streptosporangium brasiliense]
MTEKRAAYRIGAAAGLGGVTLAVIAALSVPMTMQDPFADISAADYMNGIVSAPALWVLLHLAVTVGTALKLVGLITIGETFEKSSARPLALIGNGLAIAGVSLLITTYARDGYVHTFMAETWQKAGAGGDAYEAIFASSTRTAYSTEITGVLLVLGLAPLAYGGAMLLSSLYARWVGWLGVVGGVGGVVTAGYLYSTGLTDLGYGVLYPLFGMAIPTVWLVAAALRVWRATATVQSPAPQPVAAQGAVG